MVYLQPSLVIFLVIVGAIIAVGLGYGIYRPFVGVRDQVDAERGPSQEQEQYMRSVRARNQEDIKMLAGRRMW